MVTQLRSSFKQIHVSCNMTPPPPFQALIGPSKFGSAKLPGPAGRTETVTTSPWQVRKTTNTVSGVQHLEMRCKKDKGFFTRASNLNIALGPCICFKTFVGGFSSSWILTYQGGFVNYGMSEQLHLLCFPVISVMIFAHCTWQGHIFIASMYGIFSVPTCTIKSTKCG